MNVSYFLSQVFVLFYYLFLAISYTQKNRKTVLLLSLVSTSAMILSYFFLSAWSGLAMNIVGLLRNIIFLLELRFKKMENHSFLDWLILILLLSAIVVFAIFTYAGIFSMLSVLATFIYTISVWQNNTNVYKVLGIFVSLSSLGYLIFVHSVFGIILESILLLVETIETIEYFVYNRREQKPKES